MTESFGMPDAVQGRLDLIDMYRTVLAEQWVIFLCSDIEEVETLHRILEIEVFRRRLQATEVKQDLEVLLVSPGGSVYHAFALYDALRLASRDGIRVIVTAYGMCASAAAMILLQAGDVRQATLNTSFLVHEIRRYTSPLGEERTSEVVDEVKELQRLTSMIVKLLAERCSKPETAVRRLFERKEVWQSAAEALEWGLIDKIIEDKR